MLRGLNRCDPRDRLEALPAVTPGGLRASVCGAIVALSLACPSGAVRSEQRPLWEAGAGLGLINFPDYRGSDERQTLALPFPYYIYRGERLKVDRQGVRGLLLNTRRYEFDFSMNATPPVDS